MSDAAAATGRRWAALVLIVAGVVVLLVPLYADAFSLRIGFAVCGTAIGAIGLTILTGATGQLSLAHAFFVAVGAFSYCVLAAAPATDSDLAGLGWPPPLAAVAAIALAALTGLLVSPLSSRLSGLNLGVATLALVFLGQHLLSTLVPLSGGYQGRLAPAFDVFGFTFSDSGDFVVLGVPFGRYERLWYLGVLALLAAALLARNLLQGRSGRALRLVRDHELAAALDGIDVRAVKRRSFVISSGYAGAAGVLYALAVGSVAPLSFTLDLSIQFLVMIVIGGLGSVAGAVIGALFVTGLPLVLQRVMDEVPTAGEFLTPAALSRYIYGAAVIAVLLFRPGGIASLWGPGTAPHRFATTTLLGRRLNAASDAPRHHPEREART